MDQHRNIVEKIEWLITRFAWVPFVLGVIGYYFMDGGEGTQRLDVLQTLYATIELYLGNSAFDNTNIVIDIAKILAIIVTVQFVIAALSQAIVFMSNGVKRLHKNSSVAIYTDDEEFGKSIDATFKNAYVSKAKPTGKLEKTRDHIVIFSEDVDNLMFCENNRKDLVSGKNKMFLGLNHFDTTRVKSEDSNIISTFSVDEILAREFWKNFSLHDKIQGDGEVFQIGFIGFGSTGRALFQQAFLTQLFRVNQKIEYHIWGGNGIDAARLNDVNAKNASVNSSDKIICHEKPYTEEASCIAEMEVIIIERDDNFEIMQDLADLNVSAEIYVNLGSNEAKSFFANEKLHCFGDISDFMTVENIRNEKLYKIAKLVNYDYGLLYADGSRSEDVLRSDYLEIAEGEWAGLDSFTKGSNVSRADYLSIEKGNKLMLPAEETKELEHIRWCRYHFLNGWKYGEPIIKEGKESNKDADNKTHACLVKYADLPVGEKIKDDIFNHQLKKIIEDELVRSMAAISAPPA